MEATRVVFGAPEVVELKTGDLFDSDLGNDEFVVRSHVTVISPGTELARLAGRYVTHDSKPTYPGTVGYANVGTVLASGTPAVRPGERVYTMAPHASAARVRLSGSVCVRVPDDLPDDVAAFTRFATVSMSTLTTTVARPGDQVTVIGLGLVGNLAAQVFQAAGMRVTAVDRSAARRDRAERCGVQRVHPAEAVGELRRRSRLVVEASGSPEALATAVQLAADGGEIAMVGAPWTGPDATMPAARLTGEIFTRFLHLRSGWEWMLPTHPHQPPPLSPGSLQQNSVTAMEWLACGMLRVEPLITHRWPPERAAEAYAGLRHEPDRFLGVVLDWQRGSEP